MNRNIPIAILFILAIVVAVFGSRPIYQELSALQDQMRVKEVEIQNREAYIESLKTAEQKILEQPEKIAKLQAIFPDNPDIPLLYDLLSRISSNSGLIFRGISSSMGESSGTGIQEITVDITVEGFYTALKEFLLATRKAERMLDVNSVSFQAPEGSEIFKFSIRLSTFSY